jgi:hypothetical protein
MNEINTAHLAWTSRTDGIKFKLTCKEKKECSQIISDNIVLQEDTTEYDPPVRFIFH